MFVFVCSIAVGNEMTDGQWSDPIHFSNDIVSLRDSVRLDHLIVHLTSLHDSDGVTRGDEMFMCVGKMTSKSKSL